MTILATPHVTALLERLFEASEATWDPDSDIARHWAELSDAERRDLMSNKTAYRQFYTQLKDAPLAVSRSTGQLLYMLARSANARNIVEFGTSFGVSAIHLAAALYDNGGGRLITSEFEPSKVARARQNIAEAGFCELVEVREGDALQTLSRDLPERIDLLLLDGAKGLYGDILRVLENRLRPGAMVIADDADYSPEYLRYVRAPDSGYLSVALTEDIELSMRTG